MDFGAIVAIAIVAAAAVGGGIIAFRQKRAADRAKEETLARAREKARKEFPVASPGGPKKKPAPQGEVVVDGDFIRLGSQEDAVGDPVLARRVDHARSTQKLLPDSKLFKPGDVATLVAVIVDEASVPLADVPVVWVRRAGNKRLAGPVRTNGAGEAAATYVVQPDDMSGDHSDDVPDSGSYLVDCYAGGRRLAKITLLHDVA